MDVYVSFLRREEGACVKVNTHVTFYIACSILCIFQRIAFQYTCTNGDIELTDGHIISENIKIYSDSGCEFKIFFFTGPDGNLPE